MNAKLLTTIERWKIYKLPKEVTYSENDENIKPYKYLVISDAKTHIERLAFALYLNDGYAEEDIINFVPEAAQIDFLHVTGKLTNMSQGGSYEYIYPDEWYINNVLQEVAK